MPSLHPYLYSVVHIFLTGHRKQEACFRRHFCGLSGKNGFPNFADHVVIFGFYAAQVHETLFKCYISTATNTSTKMPPDGTENNGENCISVIEIIGVMNFTLYFFFSRYQEIIYNS